jgi:hypothetical protein
MDWMKMQIRVVFMITIRSFSLRANFPPLSSVAIKNNDLSMPLRVGARYNPPGISPLLRCLDVEVDDTLGERVSNLIKPEARH